MNRFARSALPVILLVVLGTGEVRSQEIESSGDGFEVTVQKTFSVEPGGQFDLDATNGPITVSSWDRSEVSVTETIQIDEASRAEVRAFLDDHPTRYEKSDNTVRVRGPDLDEGGWWRSGDDAAYTYEVKLPRRFGATLRTSGGEVDISGLEGPVDGQTAGGDIAARGITGEVRLQTAGGSVALRDIDGPAEGKTSGGDVEAATVSGPLTLETAGGSIRVERAEQRVDVTTAGGSIRIETVGGPITARTAGGDIDIRDAEQDVTAETSGGDITLDGIGGRARVETSGGDIEGRALRGPLEATTSAGDIELRAASGPVTAETSVGDIEVEASASSYDTDPALQLSTSHGDIELTLPADVRATIQAEAEGYGGGMGRDDIRSDVPLTREGGDGDPLRARGDLNGGGPVLRLSTNGGSIQIRTVGE
jgi:DUF4097 and DUF4098 domain-containing protein YvlB